jgi:hypothetical protein
MKMEATIAAVTTQELELEWGTQTILLDHIVRVANLAFPMMEYRTLREDAVK